ncbi:MAG: hypothetical protein OEU86_06075 [Gammaproteobacteria bacterium]|nr:hypothetical protein [Gammaproteobacteria bacterium]
MNELRDDIDQGALDAADRVARAAYLWLRHQQLTGGLSVSASSSDGALMVAGVLIQLCDSLNLTAQQVLLAAWAYGWLDENGEGSLQIVRAVEVVRSSEQESAAYQAGRVTAGGLLKLLNDPGYEDLFPGLNRYLT